QYSMTCSKLERQRPSVVDVDDRSLQCVGAPAQRIDRPHHPRHLLQQLVTAGKGEVVDDIDDQHRAAGERLVGVHAAIHPWGSDASFRCARRWCESRGHIRAVPQRSNNASDSTCAVCGNMSITPAASSLKPCVRTSVPASRASEAGWHETYTTRRTDLPGSCCSKPSAPLRGGSSSIKSHSARAHALPRTSPARSPTWKS